MVPKNVVRLLLHSMVCLTALAATYDQRDSQVTYREGELNEPCRSNFDCGTYGYYCAANRTCQCMDQYLPDLEKKNCRGGVEQRCRYDEHCVEGGFCLNQTVCRCKETRPLVSFNGMRCSGGASPSSYVALVATFFFLVLNT